MSATKKKFLGTVTILGRTFRVIEVPKLVSGDDELQGEIDAYKLTICMAKEREPDTLLHEVLHGTEAALGLGLTEQQVTALARALWSAGCRIRPVKQPL